MTTTSMTFVVLGLLARRPGSGYDIAAFAEHSVRYFWPISRSQVYSELTRIEALGWASGREVRQDRYPTKRVYEISPAGLAALHDWLDGPPPAKRQRTQDAVVLKAFLGSYMSPDQLHDQLAGHRAEADKLRIALSTIIEHLDAKGVEGRRRFPKAAARYGVLQAEATIAWVEEVQAMLAAERAVGGQQQSEAD